MQAHPRHDARWRRSTRQQLCDPDSIRLLGLAGVKRGWRCWEVGAGLGSIAAWLRARVEETGSVWATELNPDLIRELEGLRPAGVETSLHNLERDPFPDADFDLVHTRFVLEHLRSREEVLHRLASSVKPRGRLVVEDAQFDAASLLGPTEFSEAMALVRGHAESQGTDFSWASTLPCRLHELGYTVSHSEVVARTFQGASTEAQSWQCAITNTFDETADGEKRKILSSGMEALQEPSMWFCGPAIVAVIGLRTQCPQI